MPYRGDAEIAGAVRADAHRLTGANADYNPLMDLIGDKRLVLLGEASHGTHDFYRERAQITKRLIRDKGFMAVAVEADWPDAYRVNRFVRGLSEDQFAVEALGDFKRFPQWMWRNTDVVEFLEWLRAFNDARVPGAPKTGFYGLDLYSLHTSTAIVLRFLEVVDPAAAKIARERYSCFDHLGEDTQVYGFLTSTGASKSCEEGVIAQLLELQRKAGEYLKSDARVSEDDIFHVEQNARLVKNAEAYYRTMYLRGESSWNVRDRHMAETLDSLVAYLERNGERAKVAVWAHNSHLGDARATDMGRRGELNLGQLVRERYGSDSLSVGFSTHNGSVTAASDWDAPAERKAVRPALQRSYEAAFHEARLGRFLLTLPTAENARAALDEPRLERAIGVIYRPETERQSHYFGAQLTEQFDAVIHIDKSLAVEPLERTAEWERGELPETYPFGV